MQISVEAKCGGKRLQGTFSETSPKRPLVTVITATYNGQPHVAGCLESVLSQDYPKIEHIVMDGASSDGTTDVLRQYDDRIALWRSEPDSGIYDAWNKAILEARGEWICFLGVDDEFLPGAVSAYMALASRNPQAEFLCSRVKVVYCSGYEKIVGDPWTWRKFSRSMCALHVGSMHRRGLFDRLGMYDTSYQIAADYELLLRARQQLKTAYLPVPTVMMRAGGASGSRIAIAEKARAKMTAGGRSKILTSIELCVDNAKFMVRPLHYALRAIAARYASPAHAGKPIAPGSSTQSS
jgi:glycosyltransferase involved in cell wall biosynthesis